MNKLRILLIRLLGWYANKQVLQQQWTATFRIKQKFARKWIWIWVNSLWQLVLANTSLNDNLVKVKTWDRRLSKDEMAKVLQEDMPWTVTII